MRTTRRVAVALLALAATASAVIVDRIAIRVGTRIVTTSEVELRVRLAAFQNRQPTELTPARLKDAAQSLIDQRLIGREMDIGRYPRLEPEKRAELLPAYLKQWFASDAGAMGAELARYGLTPGDLEEDLARQVDLLTFLGLRFRVADDDSKGNAELDTWLKEQRAHTVIEYLDKELAP